MNSGYKICLPFFGQERQFEFLDEFLFDLSNWNACRFNTLQTVRWWEFALLGVPGVLGGVQGGLWGVWSDSRAMAIGLGWTQHDLRAETCPEIRYPWLSNCFCAHFVTFLVPVNISMVHWTSSNTTVWLITCLKDISNYIELVTSASKKAI
jgi:hypothetical protein